MRDRAVKFLEDHQLADGSWWSLWYGSEDLMATPKHARWLDEHLPDTQLVMWEGEGHLLAFTHLAEMLRELLTFQPGGEPVRVA